MWNIAAGPALSHLCKQAVSPCRASVSLFLQTGFVFFLSPSQSASWLCHPPVKGFDLQMGQKSPKIKLIAASGPGTLVFSSPTSTSFNRFALICKFLWGRCSISVCKCNLEEGLEAHKAVFGSSWIIPQVSPPYDCSRARAGQPTQPPPQRWLLWFFALGTYLFCFA